MLVGVCCSGGGDETDPFAEVSLQPLPEYTIQSDGVTITCIACTDRGHIFWLAEMVMFMNCNIQLVRVGKSIVVRFA